MIVSRELTGCHLRLTPFTQADIGPQYIGWLNDPEINRYSQRRLLPPSDEASARAYLAGLADEEVILGIYAGQHGHVGNIKFGPVDQRNRRCDISILIGERAVWNTGVGREAVYLVARHLFKTIGLNRIDAGTCNPGFVRMVTSIGWQIEGVMRQRVWLGDRLHDYTVLAQLAADFVERPELEICS